MTQWVDTAGRLGQLATRTLFFVGGAPRSGTTWLQQMLNAHPEVCCRGEGLFLHHFTIPLERLAADRARVIDGKNRDLFGHTGGFPNFAQPDIEHLAATAILLGLNAMAPPDSARAIGEKTPENVFFFPRLHGMFPDARFIAIARDPRDALSSAWHFFAKAQGQDQLEFIRSALPSMESGSRAILDVARAWPNHCRVVTYERLRADPVPVLRTLFGLLGVESGRSVVEQIVAATEFSAATGRAAGQTREGVFHRRGIVGDWRESLTPAAETMIMDMLGWSFAPFGWTA